MWLENNTSYGYRAVPEQMFDQIKSQGLIPDWDMSRDPQEYFDLFGGEDDFHYENAQNLVLFFASDEDSAKSYGDLLFRFPWPHDANKVSISSEYFTTSTKVNPQQIEVETSNYEWVPILQAGFVQGRHTNKEVAKI